jgi:hypothetical protein
VACCCCTPGMHVTARFVSQASHEAFCCTYKGLGFEITPCHLCSPYHILTIVLVCSQPYAQCYREPLVQQLGRATGRNKGSWAGQLGDGRAITLGEIVSSQGQRWELQLKGAGKTPYSRRADGRAVMRSSIREFIASESMAALGVSDVVVCAMRAMLSWMLCVLLTRG